MRNSISSIVGHRPFHKAQDCNLLISFWHGNICNGKNGWDQTHDGQEANEIGTTQIARYLKKPCIVFAAVSSSSVPKSSSLRQKGGVQVVCLLYLQ